MRGCVARDDVERNALFAETRMVSAAKTGCSSRIIMKPRGCPAFHIPLIGKTINGSDNENAAGIGKSVHRSTKGFIDIGNQNKLRNPVT